MRNNVFVVVGVVVILISISLDVKRRSSQGLTHRSTEIGVGGPSVGSSASGKGGSRRLDGSDRADGKTPEEDRLAGARANSIPAELAFKTTNGYYIMMFESGEGRKLVERNARQSAEAYGERINAEYAPLFSNLGLSDQSKNMLSNHLASIEQGRTEAESYLLQLGAAKDTYDKKVKELLSPEQYREYRAIEEARPAQRDLKAIGEFFAAEGIAALGSDQQSRLYEALKASKSTRVADGPYGSGAHALVGKQPVFDATTEDLRRLRSEHSTLLSNLPTTSEWDTVRQGISQYYGAQILGKQKTLEFMNQESPVHPPIPGQP